MGEEPFILDFDENKHAVIETDFEQLPFKFHSRLLFAFVPKSDIDDYLNNHLHKVLGKYDTISFQPEIYEVDFNGEKITLCQAPLGAPAATQLLDWLISYGVKEVLAVGNAGALRDLPENAMFIPIKAIRDEGTSFHYLKSGQFVDLRSEFLNKIEQAVTELNLKYDEITTWTTDAFFRETPKKVAQFKQLGAATVEMECAALVACAQFRKVDFAQILFTADSLANLDNYDARNGGEESHSAGLDIGSQVLLKI